MCDEVELVERVHGLGDASGSGPEVSQDLLDVGMGVEVSVMKGFSP